MDITLLVICVVVVLYLGACVRQWLRLSRDDKTPGDPSVSPPYRR